MRVRVKKYRKREMKNMNTNKKLMKNNKKL